MRRRYTEVTQPVTGYPLDMAWYAVEPPTADVINLIANPSIEVNTTGYSAISGGTISRSIAAQQRGAYALRYGNAAVAQDGVYYTTTVSLVAGTLYSWGFDFWGNAGQNYEAYISSTAGLTPLSLRLNFPGNGYWTRQHMLYEETGTAARRLVVRKVGSNVDLQVLYLDGMLLVAGTGEYVYFDGDTLGLTPLEASFFWTGTSHGSTSIMRAHTRAGGILRKLSDYGLTIMAVLGAGLPNPTNTAIPLALPGGEQYQRTLATAHDFSLVGSLTADSFPELQRQHGDLEALFDVRRQAHSQPLLLQYEPVDGCGDSIGQRFQIECSFAGGLDGQWDNHYQEDLNLRFRVHLPYLARLDGADAATLASRTVISTAAAIVRRNQNGLWQGLGTGLNSSADVSLWLPDGRLLVGGAFTNAGGDANADFLAVYDPTSDTFSSLNATPLNAAVKALLLLPEGNVLVGGLFTNAGGFADADFLTKLTISTGAFSALNATPLSDEVDALALLPNNNVAVGGNFLNAGGDANADYLCKLTTSTGAYSAFTSSSSLNSVVYTLAVTKSGTLMIGGNFSAVFGQPFIAALRPPGYTVYQTLFTPANLLNNAVRTITPLTNGKMIVGGDFTNVLGVSDWDYLLLGTDSPTFSEIILFFNPESLIAGVNAPILTSSEGQPGVNYIGGDFTGAGGITVFDRLLQFSKNSILPIDLDLPGSPEVRHIIGRANGEIVVGFTTGSTGYTSGTTTVTNIGTANAFPIIVLQYAAAATVTAALYSIRNLTTGQVISFNLSLLPGETLTLDLRPGFKTITSSVRGNLISSVLPGSNLATFKLSPRSNVLNLFIDIAAAANVTSYAWWEPTYASLEGAIR